MSTRAATILMFFLLVAHPAIAEPDFSGIWMLSGRALEGDLVMTDRARAIQEDYDLLVDDPSLACEPASISRVWANPNVRIEFIQSADRILVNYEFYDLRREIPIGGSEVVADVPSTKNVDGTRFSKMGSSFARYANDRLIIETTNHTAGFIRTSRGIPQSEQTAAFEVLWLEGEVLHLSLTYIDDTLFEAPFVLTHEFTRTGETNLPLYDCTDANYDWFEKLNAPQSGEFP
jgi:hypothetical protein